MAIKDAKKREVWCRGRHPVPMMLRKCFQGARRVGILLTPQLNRNTILATSASPHQPIRELVRAVRLVDVACSLRPTLRRNAEAYSLLLEDHIAH